MQAVRRIGARCRGVRGIPLSPSPAGSSAWAAPATPSLLAVWDRRHRSSSTSTSTPAGVAALDLPPPPTASEISATIAEAEARAQVEHQVERVQHMPIRAVHVARKMDIVSLFQKLYTDRFKVTHFLHKDSIVLRLSGHGDHPVMPAPGAKPDAAAQDLTTLSVGGNLASRRAKDKWVVYFDYGAVVFFNCDQALVSTLIKHAQRFCSDVFDMRGHEEELLLVSNPALQKWSDLVENNILVREIDHINVHVIAGVLSQTVALEYYERQIEAILSEFEKLNASVEKNGPKGALFDIGFGEQTERQQHKKLFKIVATNNALMIDLVSKLRVIDRKRPGDAAWSHTRYHNMWESLLEEFELNERFNNLNFKLELIQHNTKFFLEVLGSHKGERMEWYIIILIAAELAIGVYEFAMKLH
jgi:uncharacterized Rmd1/YagE family protein